MRLPVHIWIREVNASPDELACYFIELARRLDEKPQKMRLMIESTEPAVLDFDPTDGNPTVTVGGRTRKFDVRRRWIPEHPVPLQFGPDPKDEGSVPKMLRRTVLLIDPVDNNRFRVCDRRYLPLPGWAYALLAVTGATAAVTLHPIAVGVTIFTFLVILVLKLLPLWYNSHLKIVKD